MTLISLCRVYSRQGIGGLPPIFERSPPDFKEGLSYIDKEEKIFSFNVKCSLFYKNSPLFSNPRINPDCEDEQTDGTHDSMLFIIFLYVLQSKTHTYTRTCMRHLCTSTCINIYLQMILTIYEIKICE